MTDNEIIKALEYCQSETTENCNKCPLVFKGACQQECLRKALDLINRQQADLEFAKNINALQMEELQKAQADNERLKKLLEEADVNYNKCAKRFYKEGVKEFAERLKEKAFYCERTDRKDNFMVAEMDIDNLVAEMVGDD